MEKQRKYRRIRLWSVLFLASGMLVYSGCRLWAARQDFVRGEAAYAKLAGLAWEGGSPDAIIDFAALQGVNPDILAWIYCPGTELNYPVIQATDYDYYLHHLPDGRYNGHGTPFLDDSNPSDFSGRLTIIYGRNIKSDKMFGNLTRYKQQAYFAEHPSVDLYTAGYGRYRIDLLYGCEIGEGEWRERAFMFESNLSSLLTYAAHNTTFESEASYTENDRFVVLSACSYRFDGARYVVIGVLK